MLTGLPLLPLPPYKGAVLVLSSLVWGWEGYLSLRQHRRLRHATRIPAALEGAVKEEDFAKAQAYGLDKSRFGLIQSAFQHLLSTGLLVWDVLPLYWTWAGVGAAWAGWPANEVAQSLAFCGLLYLQSTVVGLPFDLYSTFGIEQRHGFNKQTMALFFSDLAKTAVLTLVIGAPVLAAFISIIQWAGAASFHWYVWAFMFAFQITMLLLYPTVIQPLFNTFRPLEAGELRGKIEALASRISFPLTQLFVVDGSRRSGHSNAYFFGFGKNKRIVMYDTLIEQSTPDEVCGVLAHELGHWHESHVFKMLAINQVHLLALFWSFGFFIHSREMYESFGFRTQPILIGFLLFQYLLTPVESVLGFLMNLLSRFHEFQADAYAKRLGYAASLRSGLVKIHVKNLGNMVPDKWYSMWNYSHPPLVERLEAIGKAE